MGKFSTIIKTTWQRALVYRFSIVSYRIGEIIEILFLIVMWTAIYKNREIVSGYTLPQMVTYILVGNLITYVTRNFLSDIMSREIKDGTLSLFVVKPLTYFRYVFVRELGRMTFPFLLSLVTHLTVALFFLEILVINTNLLTLLVITLIVFCAFLIEFLLSYLIGLIAFWTDEVRGVYDSISNIKRFLAGGYFPLALLPALYVNISFALPFAYSFFVPTQLYLGKISILTGLKGVLIQIAWIIILYLIIKLVWRRGIRKYEGVGI